MNRLLLAFPTLSHDPRSLSLTLLLDELNDDSQPQDCIRTSSVKIRYTRCALTLQNPNKRALISVSERTLSSVHPHLVKKHHIRFISTILAGSGQTISSISISRPSNWNTLGQATLVQSSCFLNPPAQLQQTIGLPVHGTLRYVGYLFRRASNYRSLDDLLRNCGLVVWEQLYSYSQRSTIRRRLTIGIRHQLCRHQ